MGNTYAGLTKDQTFAIEKKCLKNTQEAMVLDRFTVKKTQPKQSGKNLKFHYWDHISDNDIHVLAEGVTPDSTAMVRVGVDSAIKYRGGSVKFTDELMLNHENALEFHKETALELSYALGVGLEKEQFTIALAGAGTTITTAGDINADLKLVRKALRTANAGKFTTIKSGSTKSGTVPVNAGWYGFCSLDDGDLFRAATDFISVEDYGYSENIVDNEIGVIKSLGLRIVETQHMVDGNSLFIGEDALGSVSLGGKNKPEYIVKELGEAGVGINGSGEAVSDDLNQNGSSGIKCSTGFVVLRADKTIKLTMTV